MSAVFIGISLLTYQRRVNIINFSTLQLSIKTLYVSCVVLKINYFCHLLQMYTVKIIAIRIINIIYNNCIRHGQHGSPKHVQRAVHVQYWARERQVSRRDGLVV